MRKTFLLTIPFFSFVLNASEKSNLEPVENFLECHTRITVDCNGDGIDDYQETVRCEYAEAMKQQLIASCGGNQQ